MTDFHSLGLATIPPHREEDLILAIAVRAGEVAFVVGLAILLWLLYALITDRAPLPARIQRRLPRVPASRIEQRKSNAGLALVFAGMLMNIGSTLLSVPPSAPKVITAHGALELALHLGGGAAFLALTLAGFGLLATVDFLDRRTNTVASAWGFLNGDAGRPRSDA